MYIHMYIHVCEIEANKKAVRKNVNKVEKIKSNALLRRQAEGRGVGSYPRALPKGGKEKCVSGK